MALPELYIHGVGHFHPDNVIDNEFLTSLEIGSDEQWILERVGIRARRTVLPLSYIFETKNAEPTKAHAVSCYSDAQTGAAAAKMALARAGLEAKDIGLVVAGGCSPQHNIPAEACIVAAELGIQAQAFDLRSACSSFAVQLHWLRAMREESLPDYILVINTENNTRVIDYSDRGSAVLWGDGSAATVVSTRIPARLRVRFTMVESDPSGWAKVIIPTGQHFTQHGSAVQGFAIRKTLSTLALIREQAEDAQKMYFIGHQANLGMLNSVCARAEIAPDRHLFNVDEYGNCGSAGAPMVLSQNWDKFVPGEELGIVVVGSGLTWGGMLIHVDEPSKGTK